MTNNPTGRIVAFIPRCETDSGKNHVSQGRRPLLLVRIKGGSRPRTRFVGLCGRLGLQIVRLADDVRNVYEITGVVESLDLLDNLDALSEQDSRASAILEVCFAVGVRVPYQSTGSGPEHTRREKGAPLRELLAEQRREDKVACEELEETREEKWAGRFPFPESGL